MTYLASTLIILTLLYAFQGYLSYVFWFLGFIIKIIFYPVELIDQVIYPVGILPYLLVIGFIFFLFSDRILKFFSHKK